MKKDLPYKSLADCIKEYFPSPILSNQIAYIKGRFISEARRLFLYILKVTDFMKLRELPVAVHIQEAFVNHLF